MKNRAILALAAGAAAAVAIGGTAALAGRDSAPAAVAVTASASPSEEVILEDPATAPDDSSSASADTGSPAADRPAAPADDPSPSGPLPAEDAAPSGAISAEEASRIALLTTGGGRITKIERETEHGRPVYAVEVQLRGVEHDLDVDRETGQVLRHRSDDDKGRGHGRDRDDRYEPGDDRDRNG